jgi:hypothetical protein
VEGVHAGVQGARDLLLHAGRGDPEALAPVLLRRDGLHTPVGQLEDVVDVGGVDGLALRGGLFQQASELAEPFGHLPGPPACGAGAVAVEGDLGEAGLDDALHLADLLAVVHERVALLGGEVAHPVLLEQSVDVHGFCLSPGLVGSGISCCR